MLKIRDQFTLMMHTTWVGLEHLRKKTIYSKNLDVKLKQKYITWKKGRKHTWDF